jgi:hypothetical protein
LGTVKQKKNSVSLIQRLAESERAEMWIIKWSCGAQSGFNHVFTGSSDYDTVKGWVEILESQYGEDTHFDELTALR